jgi:Utp14 protein
VTHLVTVDVRTPNTLSSHAFMSIYFIMIRLAYHESVQLGHELSKRIHEDPSRRKDDGDGGGDSSGDEEFETEAKEGQKKKKASDRAAREMLSVLEGAEDEPEAQGKYKKLFEMDFMKRATDQKKEKSREEAQNILRELQDMESYNSSGDEDGDAETRPEKVLDAKSSKGVIAAAMKKEADSEALVAARAEIARQMGSGSLTLRTGSKKVSVSGPISINTDDKSTKKKGKNAAADNSTGVRWLSETEEDVADITAAASTEDNSNPWLAAPTLGRKRDSNGLHTNITVASGRSKGEGAEKLYVTVADIGNTINTSKNAAKKNKGQDVKQSKQTGEAALLSVSTDGAKRPASTTLESKNSMKKAKVEGSSSSGKGNSDTSLTAAKAVVTPAPTASDSAAGMSAKFKERKPLLLQRSQVNSPFSLLLSSSGHLFSSRTSSSSNSLIARYFLCSIPTHRTVLP